MIYIFRCNSWKYYWVYDLVAVIFYLFGVIPQIRILAILRPLTSLLFNIKKNRSPCLQNRHLYKSISPVLFKVRWVLTILPERIVSNWEGWPSYINYILVLRHAPVLLGQGCLSKQIASPWQIVTLSPEVC